MKTHKKYRRPGMLRRNTQEHEVIIPARWDNPALKFITPADWSPAQRNHLRDTVLSCQIFGKALRIPNEVQVYELLEESWHHVLNP